MVVPSPTWRAAKDFPPLAALPIGHVFEDALAALVETYLTARPPNDVQVLLRGPYPWASVDICIGDQRRATAVWYSDEGDEDGPGKLARIEKGKERQRRRFVALGGDLNVTALFTDRTIAALGTLIRT
jgi:hypothetical protein